MKIRIEKEVSIASAFTHLIAAWDVGPYPWYRSVKYTKYGEEAISQDKEPPHPRNALAFVTMIHPSEGDVIEFELTGRWIENALNACVAKGGAVARDAMRIIDEDPSADQETADLVMQMGAYGRIVFG